MVDARDDDLGLEALDQPEAWPGARSRPACRRSRSRRVPSPNGTSSTHSGRRVVIERADRRAVAVRRDHRRARRPSTPSSARRRACRPSASIPSSFVSRTSHAPLQDRRRAACAARHRRQAPAVRRHGGPRPRGAERRPPTQRHAAVRGAVCPPRARRAREQRAKSSTRAARGDLEHRPDEHAVHVAQERVGLDPELEQVAVAPPTRRASTSRSKRTCSVSVGREGREVVRAGQRAPRTRAARRGRRRCGHQQRAAALERAARARGRARGSSRSARGASRRASKPVGRRLAGAAPRRRRGSSALSDAAATGAPVGRRRPGPRRGRRGRCARRRSARPARAAASVAQRALELALHGAQAGLARPAGEAAAVVLESVERGRRDRVSAPPAPRRRGARRALRPARGRPSRSSPSGAGRA